MEVTANGYRVSAWNNGNILEIVVVVAQQKLIIYPKPFNYTP